MINASILIIRLYKITLSPILEYFFGKGCRYSPTCSEYTEIAIKRFGVSKGFILSLKRILRCHPFAKGMFDPVPLKIN